MHKKFKNIVLNDVILKSMPGIPYIFAKDGKLVGWGSDTIGYSEEDLQNIYIQDLIHEDEREYVIEKFKEVFEKGYVQFEHVSTRKSGERKPVLATLKMVEIEGELYAIGLSVDISELKDARILIDDQVKEINRLNELLNAENLYLRDQISINCGNTKIVGESESLKYIFFRIDQVASTDATVLVEGETGTGKDLIAREIHNRSPRKDKPFVKVNCSSIPENLFESELFGHEKGAYTGAIEKQIGRFELANGGTIFLDEISEIPLSIQSKLLHVIQDREFQRVGSSKTRKSDVRIISATNRVLEDEVKSGRFRSDLYYRINVFPITISPLRERISDIPMLVEYFVKMYSEKFGRTVNMIPKEFLNRLTKYSWPGNIRELENIVERAVITSKNNVLRSECLLREPKPTNGDLTFNEVQRNTIFEALQKTNWKISGADGAASRLKLNPDTLRSKMKKLGISRSD